jgi:peroxiredoxin/outer membrane lipoprotein-sorting protein
LPLLSGRIDTGKEWLDAWEQRLKTAKTISGSLELKGGGTDEKIDFQYARPNLSRITGESVSFYCDGKEMVTYVPADNKYTKRKAGRKLAAIGLNAFGMEALAGAESNFQYKSFEDKDGKIVLTMSHKPGAITIIGPRMGISGDYEMTWTFNKESKALEGFALNAPDGLITGTYKDIKFDSPIAKEAFNFTLPKDAEPYEELDYDEKLLAIGTKAPDMTLKTTTGETIQLSEFVKSRKVTLVNFWFYGCGGCMMEFPNINRLNKQYASKGFAVLGVDPLDEAKTAADYLRESKFSFPSLISKGTDVKSDKLYKVEAYPTNYVLGPDMTILDRFTGEDEDRLLDAMEKAGIKIEEESR